MSGRDRARNLGSSARPEEAEGAATAERGGARISRGTSAGPAVAHEAVAHEAVAHEAGAHEADADVGRLRDEPEPGWADAIRRGRRERAARLRSVFAAFDEDPPPSGSRDDGPGDRGPGSPGEGRG